MTVSRRRVLQVSATTATLLAGVAFETPADTGSDYRSPRLKQSIDKCTCLAVSDDGGFILLSYGSDPIKRFTTGWPKARSITNQGLAVMRISDWARLWSLETPNSAWGGSFFRGSNHFLAQVPLYSAREQMLILGDPAKGSETIETISDLDSVVREYYACNDGLAVVAEYHSNSPGRDRYWLKYNVAGQSSTHRIPYGLFGESSDPQMIASPAFSADRTHFAHAFRRALVMRNSEDLGRLWSFDPGGTLRPRRIGISATGAFVVVALVEEGRSAAAVRKKTVAVLNGGDGKLLSSLMVDGTAGVAISPNGSCVAVGEVVHVGPDRAETKLMIRLIDTRTKADLAVVELETVNTAGGHFLNAAFSHDGVQFSSSGDALVASATRTRIWTFQR